MYSQDRALVVEPQTAGLDAPGLGTPVLDTVDKNAGHVSRYQDGCARKVLIFSPGHVDLSSLSLTNDVCGGHPGKCWGHSARYSYHVAGNHAAEEAIVCVCVENDAYQRLRCGFVALVSPLLVCLFLLPRVFPLPAGPDAGLDACCLR